MNGRGRCPARMMKERAQWSSRSSFPGRTGRWRQEPVMTCKPTTNDRAPDARCTSPRSLRSTEQRLTTRHRVKMSAPSIAPYILKRPWLKRWVMPLAQWYCEAAGYRKLGEFPGELFRRFAIDHHTGLKADDLIPEESEVVQLALKRLPPKEAYDRVFRLRRAFQV